MCTACQRFFVLVAEFTSLLPMVQTSTFAKVFTVKFFIYQCTYTCMYA